MARAPKSLDPEPTIPFRPNSLQGFDRDIGDHARGHVGEIVDRPVGGAVLPPRPAQPTSALPPLAQRLKTRLERQR
jgi:hypothetical protein